MSKITGAGNLTLGNMTMGAPPLPRQFIDTSKRFRDAAFVLNNHSRGDLEVATTNIGHSIELALRAYLHHTAPIR